MTPTYTDATLTLFTGDCQQPQERQGRIAPGREIDPRTGCPRFHLYDPKGGGCLAGACPNSTGPDVGA